MAAQTDQQERCALRMRTACAQKAAARGARLRERPRDAARQRCRRQRCGGVTHRFGVAREGWTVTSQRVRSSACSGDVSTRARAWVAAPPRGRPAARGAAAGAAGARAARRFGCGEPGLGNGAQPQGARRAAAAAPPQLPAPQPRGRAARAAPRAARRTALRLRAASAHAELRAGGCRRAHGQQLGPSPASAAQEGAAAAAAAAGTAVEGARRGGGG